LTAETPFWLGEQQGGLSRGGGSGGGAKKRNGSRLRVRGKKQKRGAVFAVVTVGGGRAGVKTPTVGKTVDQRPYYNTNRKSVLGRKGEEKFHPGEGGKNKGPVLSAKKVRNPKKKNETCLAPISSGKVRGIWEGGGEAKTGRFFEKKTKQQHDGKKVKAGVVVWKHTFGGGKQKKPTHPTEEGWEQIGGWWIQKRLGKAHAPSTKRWKGPPTSLGGKKRATTANKNKKQHREMLVDVGHYGGTKDSLKPKRTRNYVYASCT